tara:strand:- start:126 stop:464 length:339 start_codon:yes stop_codon:yes gene_type:complete
MIKVSVSKKTLNELDKIIQNYKENILKDINKQYNLEINNKELIEMFLERKENLINYKKKKHINYENCMARVWIKKYGYFQCNRKKKCSGTDFCDLHKNKLNYGRVDEKIIMD